MSVSTRSDSTLEDCSPISPACIRALTDKMEEKRKLAASEIEKMTCEFSMSNNLTMINRLIIVLGRKLCLSPTSPNTRKGGLIGLAAVMVGFKNGSIIEPPTEIVEEVVRPILTCFIDSDPRVRYFACESLYNVTKVAKFNILVLFPEIFDNMTKVVADVDITVRSGAEMLDRLLKDIIVDHNSFDVKTFVPRLEEYIYTKNPFTRMFIISWIRLLDSRTDLIDYLPQLLDGIFNCLYDSTEEIHASTLNLLSEFLNKIVVRSTEKVNIPSLTIILIKHAQNEKEDVVQYTAIAWLRQFIGLMDYQNLVEFSPGILAAILPCLAIQSTSEGSISSSRDRYNNSGCQRFVTQSPNRGNICEISALVNNSLQELLTTVIAERKITHGSDSTSHDLELILEVLVQKLEKQEHPIVKLAVLDWFKKLKKAESKFRLTNNLQKKLFQTLLDTLSARSDAVVKNTLRVIADVFCFDPNDDQQQVTCDNVEDNLTQDKDEETADLERRKSPVRTNLAQTKEPRTGMKKVAIATEENVVTSQSNANLMNFIQALCKMFRDKDSVFEERGTFIVLNLCSIIKPEVVYKSFAEILKDDKNDLKFSYNMVQKLNQILLTTQPLFGLRSSLSNDDDPEMTALFLSLFHAWCHSPIAVLTLCLLTNNYRCANEIVLALSRTDINVDMLTQIDWVVQLIESPVFATLRMRLLDVNINQYLLQSLYGLLMILPQSEAYKRLGNRLDQVYKFMIAQPYFKSTPQQSALPHSTSKTGIASSGTSKDLKRINQQSNLEPLMKHYFNLQNQHRQGNGRISEND